MSCIESDQDIEINDSKVKMIHEEKDLYKENLEFRRWIILFNFAIVQ